MPTKRSTENLSKKKSAVKAAESRSKVQERPSLKAVFSDQRFPSVLIARLSDDNSSISEQSILRATLIAWMFCPKDSNFIKQAALVRATALLLAKYYRTAKKGMSDRERFIKFLKRSSYRWLLDEAFFALGGVNELLHGRSRKEFSESLRKARGDFVNVLPLVHILHFYVDKVANEAGRREFKPSLEAAIKVYMRVKGVTVPSEAAQVGNGVVSQKPVANKTANSKKKISLGSRQLKQYWSAFRPSLPFLYAAFVFRDRKGQIFAERLTKDEFGKKLSPMDFNEFLGVAKYIHERVFVRMANSENWDYSFPSSLEVRAVDFPPVSPDADLAIQQVFVDRRGANTKA